MSHSITKQQHVPCGTVWGIQEIHDRCECTLPKGHDGDHKCWCGRERA